VPVLEICAWWRARSAAADGDKLTLFTLCGFVWLLLVITGMTAKPRNLKPHRPHNRETEPTEAVASPQRSTDTVARCSLTNTSG
jgi:hypothetical protein